MAGKRAWELEQAFFAYFHANDASETQGLRRIAELISKEYGKTFTAPTIGSMVNSVATWLETDPTIKDSYEKFKQEQNQAKYFWRMGTDGKIESPYISVREKAQQVFGTNGYYPDNFFGQLRMAEKFWLFIGRKKPEDWTMPDYHNYLATISRGSKFGVSVALRAFCKTYADKKNMTKGQKGLPHFPAVMKIKEFPEIFQKWKGKVLELTPAEQRGDMEFILRVKPATGIRTGERRHGRGLFGTRLGAPWKTSRNFNGSHIQVAGNSLIWHVFEKMKEEWDITFLSDDLRAYIINFVKAKQTAKGEGGEKSEWLIDAVTESQVNRIFAQASESVGIEKLEMHDMRKVYITFLVRAGIPLEKAIRLNVGWKDIGTAYKHYLVLTDLGEKEEELKQRFTSLLTQGGAS
jgi:hypothetical protein